MGDDSIADFMTDFCNAGAEAIRCYANTSGFEPARPPYMPEHFMPSFVFEKLAARRRMVLEAPLAWLIKLDDETRARRHLPQRSPSETFQEMAEWETMSQRPRADMVVFSGAPTEDSGLSAIVEFKCGQITDQRRILRLLRLLNTCPYGIACGWVAPQWIEAHKHELSGKLCTTEVELIAAREKYLFGALLIENPNR